MQKSKRIKSKDGTALFVRETKFPQSQDVVVLVHGFSEHSGNYGHVMQSFHNAGMNVLAFDFRGHGKSAGMRGYIDEFEQYIHDLDSAVKIAKKKHGVQNVWLVAHSMGGLVATHYSSRFPKSVKGLVLSAPLFGIKVEVPKWKSMLSDVASRVAPWLSLPSEIRDEILTHDERFIQVLKEDDLRFDKVRARWFTEMVKHCEDAHLTKTKLEVPLLLQLSNEDWVVDSDESSRWFENCLAPRKDKIIYDGFYHKLYHELEKDKPINDAIQWLKQIK